MKIGERLARTARSTARRPALGAVQRALVAADAPGRIGLEAQRGDQAGAAAAHAVGPARVLLQPVHARPRLAHDDAARRARPRACRRPRAPLPAPGGSGARRCTGCARAAGGADRRRSRRTAATRRRPGARGRPRSGGRGTAVSPRALAPARTPWEGSPDAPWARRARERPRARARLGGDAREGRGRWRRFRSYRSTR